MGARQFMGRPTNIHIGVVQNEVFDMNELAVDPGARAGVQEMRARDPALANRTDAQPLVQPGQSVLGSAQRTDDCRPWQRDGKLVSH